MMDERDDEGDVPLCLCRGEYDDDDPWCHEFCEYRDRCIEIQTTPEREREIGDERF